MRPALDECVGNHAALADYLLGPRIAGHENRIARRDWALGLAHALLEATGETDLAGVVSERLADVVPSGKTTRRKSKAEAANCSKT